MGIQDGDLRLLLSAPPTIDAGQGLLGCLTNLLDGLNPADLACHTLSIGCNLVRQNLGELGLNLLGGHAILLELGGSLVDLHGVAGDAGSIHAQGIRHSLRAADDLASGLVHHVGQLV